MKSHLHITFFSGDCSSRMLSHDYPLYTLNFLHRCSKTSGKKLLSLVCGRLSWSVVYLREMKISPFSLFSLHTYISKVVVHNSGKFTSFSLVAFVQLIIYNLVFSHNTKA